MDTAMVEMVLRFTQFEDPEAGVQKMKIEYQFEGDSIWFGFGDPLPVNKYGMANDDLHDVYHLSLLQEVGWSAVLGVLLAGENGGQFGAIPELMEEGVVFDWYDDQPDSPEKTARKLRAVGANITDPHAVERARIRGRERLECIKAVLAEAGVAHLRTKLDAEWVQKVIAWRSGKDQTVDAAPGSEALVDGIPGVGHYSNQRLGGHRYGRDE